MQFFFGFWNGISKKAPVSKLLKQGNFRAIIDKLVVKSSLITIYKKIIYEDESRV